MAGWEAVMFGIVGTGVLELAFWNWRFEVWLDAHMNVMIPVSYSLDRWGWSLGGGCCDTLMLAFEC